MCMIQNESYQAASIFTSQGTTTGFINTASLSGLATAENSIYPEEEAEVQRCHCLEPGFELGDQTPEPMILDPRVSAEW